MIACHRSQSHSESILLTSTIVQNQYGEKFTTRCYSTTIYCQQRKSGKTAKVYSDSDRLIIHLPPESPDTEENPPETGLTLDETVDGNDMAAKESNPSFCISASMV